MRKVANQGRNDNIFSNALWKLLDVLSRWEKLDPNHGQELTLELSAHSPSDSMHGLNRYAEDQDDYPYRASIFAQRDYIERYYKDAVRLKINHYERLGHIYSSVNHINDPTFAVTAPNDAQNLAERAISLLKFDYASKYQLRLPEVKMVSSFLMRRQFYRSIGYQTLRRLVAESFTALRELRFERWRLADPVSQEKADWILGLMLLSPQKTGGILGSNNPSPLEKLSLFEDSSKEMHGEDEVNEPRTSRSRILQWVANSAVNIKHLSVSFMSDAKDCLELPAHTFPNLESLALTSQHWLQPAQKNTEKLFHLAATAALKMPKLQIMEIWTCGAGHAAILRYEATSTAETTACRLTWRCSWDPPEPIAWDGVIEAWRHVADKNVSRMLRFREDKLPHGEERYLKYGVIMHQLKLRNLILDPTSVMQVRMGTGAENESEVEAWTPSVPDSFWSQPSNWAL